MNLFCYFLPRHPLLEIEINGVVKNSAKNKVMMRKHRNAHDMPVSILQGAGQIILCLLSLPAAIFCSS
jgi:hypothetical protein